MLNEITKPVEGYEGLYWVTNTGKVFNRCKQLKPYVNNSGYLCIKLTKGGCPKHHLVHRLVARAFVQGSGEVNHVDSDKLNNSASNLEWVTRADNLRHARDTGLWKYNEPSKGVKLGKSSVYHNVTYDKGRDRWLAGIRLNGKSVGQRRFTCEHEAAAHVNKLLDAYGLTDRPRNVILKA